MRKIPSLDVPRFPAPRGKAALSAQRVQRVRRVRRKMSRDFTIILREGRFDRDIHLGKFYDFCFSDFYFSSEAKVKAGCGEKRTL